MQHTLRANVLAVLVAVTSSAAQAQAVAESAAAPAEQASQSGSGEAGVALAETDFKVTATGTILLDKGAHSPIYAEFDGSPTLTLRLRAALKERGLEVTEDQRGSKATLIFKGDVGLVGGKKFHKGTKVSIGKATEQALASSKEVSAADVTQTVAGLALNRAAFAGAMNNFTRGLALGGMGNALGDVTGMRAWFNTKVAGDPRGICLNRCEDWNKVNQSVYVWVGLESNGSKEEVRVLTKVFSETVAPDQLIMVGVGKAIDQIKLSDEVASVTSLQSKKE